MEFRSIVQITAGTVAVIILLIGGAAAFGAFADLGAGGVFALAFGIAASLALGIGLMALIFYSNRSDRDEAVHFAAQPQHTPKPR
jgi:hypothetical protein